MIGDGETLRPPCRHCDEPCATDPHGRPFEFCHAHLVVEAEPHERAQRDPDEAMQALRDRWAS